MAGFPYHMEALRKQRIIERKHDALENLARKQKVLEEAQNSESRGDLESRVGTRASASRQGQSTEKAPRYRYVLPAKQEPLHQWYDLQNKHIHHEARSLDRNGNQSKVTDKEYWEQT